MIKFIISWPLNCSESSQVFLGVSKTPNVLLKKVLWPHMDPGISRNARDPGEALLLG
jgi:hypothetical protein